MQTIATYILNLAALISLRALISRQALRVYGGGLLLVGCLFGHVALILLGIACVYFSMREPHEPNPTQPDTTQADSEPM